MFPRIQIERNARQFAPSFLAIFLRRILVELDCRISLAQEEQQFSNCSIRPVSSSVQAFLAGVLIPPVGGGSASGSLAILDVVSDQGDPFGIIYISWTQIFLIYNLS